jgi:hypothetical protein
VPPAVATTLFPLIAALLYAFGALVLKRSSDLGVGLWRTTFVANLIVCSAVRRWKRNCSGSPA